MTDPQRRAGGFAGDVHDATQDRSVARRLLRSRLSRLGQETTIRLMDSRSLWPLLNGEAQALVRWGLPAGSDVGRLALFEGNAELLIVHRILSLDTSTSPARVLQAADNCEIGNPYARGWLPIDRVLGIVVEIKQLPSRRAVYISRRRLEHLVDTAAARTGLWRMRSRGRVRHLMGRAVSTFLLGILRLRSRW